MKFKDLALIKQLNGKFINFRLKIYMGNSIFCRLKKCVRCEQLKHCKPHSAHFPLPYDLLYCDDCWETECREWREHRREIKKEEEDGIYISRVY